MPTKPEQRNIHALFYRRTIEQDAPIEPNPMKPGTDSFFPVNASGELEEDSWSLVATAFVSKERASKPLEVLDASMPTAQLQFVLTANWAANLIRLDHTCIVWLPREDKVYELIGDPVDHTGDRRNLHIYIADNILRRIDTNSLPRRP